MLEVQTGLMNEIDLFIGSVESGGARYDRSGPVELPDLKEEEERGEDPTPSPRGASVMEPG